MYQPTQAEREANLATAVEEVVLNKVRAQIVRGTLEGFREAGHEVFARDSNQKAIDLFLQLGNAGKPKQYFRLSGEEFNMDTFDFFRQMLEAEGAPMDHLYGVEHGQGGVEIAPERGNMIRLMYQTITSAPALTRS